MIRPTWRGVGFSIVVLAVYFFAGQTQIGWLYVMVAGGFAWLVLSIVVAVWAIQGVRVRRHPVISAGRPPVEDDHLTVQLLVGTAGRTTRRFLRIVDESPVAPPDQRRVSIVIARLPGGPPTVLEYETVCYLRGVYHWPAVRIESDGPLGFFRAVRWIDAPTSLLVLPPAYSVSGVARGSRSEPAPALRPRRGPGLDLFGTRQYQQGDSFHHVHWRSTARHRELVVREYEEPRQPALAIWIDNAGVFGEGRESSLEYAVKLASTLGVWALDSDYTVTLIDRRLAVPCKSPLHLRQVLARLGAADPDPWPQSVEARRATAAVVLRAAGATGAPPDIPPFVQIRVSVGLIGFVGQLETPAEPAVVEVHAGTDLVRDATTIARYLAGSEAASGRPVRR
ncbi:MAG TPA: DUF58 domain-containing protein [Dehalococcoidia bacterium]|nr:DUF58 domain-containing protein [Dehalococcoidia bacterium]